MLSSTIDHPALRPAHSGAPPARLRRSVPQALWLGPGGLWDMGSHPGGWAMGWPTCGATGWTMGGATGGPMAAPPDTGPSPRHFAHFDAWCQAHPGQACTLWLSAWGVHELVVDAALPLAGDDALLAYARALLVHYHGDAAAHWSLTTGQAAGRRGVSALHGWPLAGLQASAHRAGVPLRWVRPWWCQALRMAVQAAPALAQATAARLLVVEGRLVSDLTLARGALAGLQQRRLADNTAAALQALVTDDPATVCWALGHGLQDGGAGQRRLTALTARTAVVVLGHLTGAAPGWPGRAARPGAADSPLAPSQPTPPQPALSQTALSQTALSQPAFSQPAPSPSAPSQPVPPQPALSQTARSQPAPSQAAPSQTALAQLAPLPSAPSQPAWAA